MAGKRLARLNEQLKREISDILRTRVRDPRVGTPTITAVDVTPDLWLARVFVRNEGDEADRKRAIEGLETAAPFVRKELGAVLRIRRIPELRFLEDRTLDQALRIERILQEVLPAEDSDADERSDGHDAPGDEDELPDGDEGHDERGAKGSERGGDGDRAQ